MNTIKIIAGKLSNGVVNYWNKNGVYADVNDFVVVENRNSYDLVRVIAEIETTESFAKRYFTNGANLKNVVSKEYSISVSEEEA